MNKVYISIGSGCAASTLLKQRGLRTQSLPFDWLLSHLKYVNDVFKSLYNDSIDDTVELFLDKSNNDTFSASINHSAGTDNSVKYINDAGFVHEQKFEAYRTTSNSSNLPYNRKYKATFPHDIVGGNTDKYVRRLSRLKNLLLDENIFLSFIYISPSSPDTHYSIDGDVLTMDGGADLNNFCEFLEQKRDNFEVIYVDSLNDTTELNGKIRKIVATPHKNWYDTITKNPLQL
jgi:hypothetical protein